MTLLRTLYELSNNVRRSRSKYLQISNVPNKLAYLVAKEEFNSALTEELNNWLNKNVSELNVAQGKAFWKTHKKLFGERSDERIETLKHRNKYCIEDSEKCDLLYQTFFSGEHLNDSTFDNHWLQEVQNFVQEQCSRTPQPAWFNENFSMAELTQAIKTTKTSNKSLDTDGCHPLMVRHMGFWAKAVFFKSC